MKNKIPLIILGVVIIIGAIIVGSIKNDKESSTVVNEETAIGSKNTTYVVEGQAVVLRNGASAVPVAPGSASSIITQYFGKEVFHDFDGDGRIDTAFILTQNSGGSGTFYYVAAALNKSVGYVGSHALLLGDRIVPQSIEMGKGDIIVVNYLDRKAGESLAATPSVEKAIWLLLDPKTMQFGEVAKDFEGEADTAKMSLNMKAWSWIHTTYSNGKEVKPRLENKFILSFKDDKTFSAKTDCNGVGGEYKATGNKLSFDKMMSTMMFCENSQESDFTKMLTETESYTFTSKGELVLTLKSNSGSVVFK